MKRGLPFSDAVEGAGLVFTSGQIGNVPGTLELVDGGIVAETRQALENLAVVLRRHNASLDTVIKCTVILVDMKEWPQMNEVYCEYFKAEPLPARTAFAAAQLALGARLEIDAVARCAAEDR